MMVFLQWIINEQDKILAAANITVAVMLIIMGCIVLYSIFVKKLKFTKITDIKIILTGAIFQSFGVALNQIYYGTYRIFAGTDVGIWLETHRSLELLPLSFLLTGTVLIVAPAWYLIQPPILRKNLAWRRKQYFITASLSIAIFWFIYIRIWGSQLTSAMQPLTTQ